MFLLFLLCFVLSVSHIQGGLVFNDQWDPFTFEITISCFLNQKPVYWYDVKFFENDKYLRGQWITKRYYETMARGTIFRTFKGAMNGDEITSDGYSVTAKFRHDCTYHGGRAELELEFKQLCEIGQPCFMRTQVDLTNNWGHHFV